MKPIDANHIQSGNPNTPEGSPSPNVPQRMKVERRERSTTEKQPQFSFGKRSPGSERGAVHRSPEGKTPQRALFDEAGFSNSTQTTSNQNDTSQAVGKGDRDVSILPGQEKTLKVHPVFLAESQLDEYEGEPAIPSTEEIQQVGESEVRNSREAALN